MISPADYMDNFNESKVLGRRSPDKALGREERDIDIRPALLRLQREKVLVTGAAGAVGMPLVSALRDGGVRVIPTDVDTSAPWGCTYMDVTDFRSVLEVVAFHEPTIIINLAAAKLAPAGEAEPWRAASINTVGVKHLLDMGRRVVQASTCKAIEPETTYGASKLISERMVLNQGGTVVRYVNIPECGPSVLTIWDKLPPDEPLPVTPCARYFMTFKEAVALTLWAAVLEPGRYKLDSGDRLPMDRYAELLWPGRSWVPVPMRRGDRQSEPSHGLHERLEASDVPYIFRVRSNHDE